MDLPNVQEYKLDADIKRTYTIYRTHAQERWEHIEEAGTRESGNLYLEKDRGGRVRAVKGLTKKYSQSRSRDFLVDLITMARLLECQDSFPRFYGWFEAEDMLLVSLEHFELGDLSSCVTGPLPEIEVHSITVQVTGALSALHSKGIMHGDLKPQNVFVSRAGPEWLVKLGDFGISKLLETGASGFNKGDIGPTTAPEIWGFTDLNIEEKSSYTSAADMWSLGCLTYRLLKARVPFETRMALARYCGKLIDPSSLFSRQDINECVADFIRQCLSASATQRISAAAALELPWLKGTVADPEDENETSPDDTTTPAPSTPSENPSAASSSLLPSSPLITSTDKRVASAQLTLPSAKRPCSQSKGADSTDTAFNSSLGSGGTSSLLRDAVTRAASAGTGTFQAPIPNRWQDAWHAEQVRQAQEARNRKQLLVMESLRQIYNEGRYEKYADVLHWAVIRDFIGAAHYIGCNIQDKVMTKATLAEAAPTNLFRAVFCNRTSEVESLIQEGADIECRNIRGETPLIFAARHGYIDIVAKLLLAGANIEQKDSMGCTAFARAAQLGHKPCASFLWEEAAAVNPRDHLGRTPVTLAAINGQTKTRNLLVIYCRAKQQEWPNLTATLTPFFILAVRLGREDMVRFLLRCGILINAKTAGGETALTIARRNGNSQLVAMLLAAGARESSPASLTG